MTDRTGKCQVFFLRHFYIYATESELELLATGELTAHKRSVRLLPLIDGFF